MTRNSNPLRYSYISKDASKANFQNKNFNKTESYNSKFIETKFVNTSFVGSKFKFCNMSQAIFDDCLIQGALFRKCILSGARFNRCIIISTQFDRTKLRGCVIENSIVLSSPLGDGFSKNNLISTEVIQGYYPETGFSEELLHRAELLRNNQFINRSSVLHRKKGRLNTISLKWLADEFGESFLIQNLPLLESLVVKDFHTLSYLKVILHKLSLSDSVVQPGPLQHRKYLREHAETCLRTDAG
ncbi:pentapeptide repeat-containing protein [Parathalassolituus penaei]|uniref:Pentapeptide repeat-containing protein n=1 Tax=Parathalassolituus penaei TaxID=2997323 RepID=A0A9X3EAK0_9GAMM|nr:pentapeptide repeat-containing protein [Parathalassolituus penaei]MCY0963993.1 pentapeptide repeat-containing protein [Parathalassolituus penaei]